MSKIDIKQQVTDKIIAHLEGNHDHGEWEKPFFCLGADRNIKSNQPYKGINTLLLGMAGYNSSYWGTYKQWGEIGGKVIKGQKATHIVFFKPITKEDADGQVTDKFFVLRGYSVFNLEQIEGIEKGKFKERARRLSFAPEDKASFSDLPVAESLMIDSGIKIKHSNSDRAFYTATEDFIHLPNKENFKATKTSTALECYYSTAFHELGHATGHPTRLNRKLGNRFGSKPYAGEELIAELTSAMLCAITGVSQSVRLDHVKYLQSWLDVLKEDKNAIFHASAQAQKAVDFLTIAEEQDEALSA
tara:strand:+ start:585 stop:1490 length:906 start_codon:yes stop_codon:yes gene_type:complete